MTQHLMSHAGGSPDSQEGGLCCSDDAPRACTRSAQASSPLARDSRLERLERGLAHPLSAGRRLASRLGLARPELYDLALKSDACITSSSVLLCDGAPVLATR